MKEAREAEEVHVFIIISTGRVRRELHSHAQDQARSRCTARDVQRALRELV